MNRRRFIFSSAAALAAGAGMGQARPRPNFILILADDLGYGELGCYGNTFNDTPNLDALAAAGTRFTDGYSSAPVCSPTRASLLSGQWPHQCGLTDYLRPNSDQCIPSEKILLSEALRDAGYHTGLIGKWHLTGYRLPQGHPQHHGFDEVRIIETKGIGNGDYSHPYRFNPEIEKRLPGREHLVDRLNLEAVDFIERNHDRPFFLYLSHYAVHTLLAGRPDLVRKYQKKSGSGPGRFARYNNPHLAAQLEAIDLGVGMIMDRLESARILDNTVVLFMGDNGGECTVTKNRPLRAGKSFLYEGGTRVPFIVWDHGASPAGACSAPVSTMDVFPTLMEMAAIDRELPLEGRSFLPDMNGENSPGRGMFWHYPLARPHFLGGRSSGAVRSGPWKLIEFYDTGARELYNLERDIGETDNLIASEPETAERLYRLLAEWRERTGAKV